MPRLTAEEKERDTPIVLRDLLRECGITQSELARAVLHRGKPVSRAQVNLTVRYGSMPPTITDYREQIEGFIRKTPAARKWLTDRGLDVKDIWTPLVKNREPKYSVSGHGRRSWAGRKGAMVPGDPSLTEEKEVNREMLTHEARKHFKILGNPFLYDLNEIKDIFLSEEHRYIKMAMEDAARHSGFIAVIGEVGSGKSAIRMAVVEDLNKDESLRIIYPRIVDKTKITAASICDAIILDLDPKAKPRMRLEQKSRQVEKYLIDRARAGCKMVLMIEEAQDLAERPRVLKLLKRFYEIQDGYKKVMGIILIGQPELGEMFDERNHYDIREVIQRCQVAWIRGLDGHIKDYLEFKFARVRVKLSDVVADGAIAALKKRLSEKNPRGGKPISLAYPLTVNNLLTRAMNLAAEMGEAKVTAAVVEAI